MFIVSVCRGLLGYTDILIVLYSVFSTTTQGFVRPNLLRSRSSLGHVAQLIGRGSCPTVNSCSLLEGIPNTSFRCRVGKPFRGVDHTKGCKCAGTPYRDSYGTTCCGTLV